MNAVAGPSNEDPSSGPRSAPWDRKILSGDTVLLRLPNAEIRSIKLESDTYVGRLFFSLYSRMVLIYCIKDNQSRKVRKL